MMIARESQRSMAHAVGPMTHMEVAALIAGRNASSHKFRKDWNVQCEYCKKMGHAKVNCYKLIGYPPDFKFRKKVGNPNTPDPRGGDQRSQAHAGKTDDRAHSEIGQNRSACVHNCKDVTSQGKSISSEGENSGRYSDDWNKGTGSSSYSHSQYNQMMQHMDNQHHCNQFRRLVDKDTVGESSNMNRLSDSANMGGEFFTSHMTVGASGTPSAGNASVPSLNACRKEWIIDTGASNHMISHKEMLNTANKRIVIEDKKVYLPNGDTVDVSHIGSCEIMDGKTLTNVLYIPDFRFNLLSVSRLTKELQCSVSFFPNFCIFQDLSSGKVLEIGEENDGLYLLNHKGSTDNNERPVRGLLATKNKADILLWHRRLGHASVGAMKRLFNFNHDECKQVLDTCEICPLAKQSRLPFPDSNTRSVTVFDLLHLDVWGPFHVPTFDGNKLFLTIVDDYSRMTWIFLLKLKSDVVVVLRDFIKLVSTQFGKIVKKMRSDNGTEFVNSECDNLFKSYGIIHQKSCVYTPQQNEVVERKHRYILELARAIRFQGSIPLKFWGHCVLGAVYMMNRLPSIALKGKTPFEMFHGCKGTCDHFRTMGCLCYAKTLPTGDKFTARAIPAVHMGYSEVSKGYVLYNLETNCFFISRDVVFNERQFSFQDTILISSYVFRHISRY